MRQIPQSRCSAAGEGSAAELLRGDARRQDLLLLDVHKTCTPMLTLLHSSVACVNVGAPAWDCLVVHFLAREFSGLELSFKLCGWRRKLLFNDVWEERGADKGGYSSTRGDVWRTSARTHTHRDWWVQVYLQSSCQLMFIHRRGHLSSAATYYCHSRTHRTLLS